MKVLVTGCLSLLEDIYIYIYINEVKPNERAVKRSEVKWSEV